MAFTKRDKLKRAAYSAVDHANRALAQGDVHGAKTHLANADAIAAQGATALKGSRNGKDRQAANELDILRTNINTPTSGMSMSAIPLPTPGPQIIQAGPTGEPTMPFNPTASGLPQRPDMLGIMDPSGYSRGGGAIQAPAGAGMYMRVPFTSLGDNGVAAFVGQPFETVLAGTGIAQNHRMQTPQLSWLQYRLRGLVIERNSDAAGARDIVNVQDLREQGGPNLIIGEGQLGVDSFRMGDRHLVGLRYNPVVTSPNVLELVLNGSGPNAGGGLTNTVGNTAVYCSAIIETIEDTTYGHINSMTARLNLGHFGGGQGQGYYFPSGAPLAGTIQRVPMRVAIADGINPLGVSGFTVGAAANTVNLISEQISWAELQIVGIEIATPVKGVATDVLLFEDLQCQGGASLFPQEQTVPAIN